MFKNECMAQYLADLISVAGHQLNGKSIEGSSLVNRLIEERVTLERIRPLEEKLKYKIDKLTKIAHGNIDKNDPLQIKPNVDNLDLSGSLQTTYFLDGWFLRLVGLPLSLFHLLLAVFE